MYIKHGLNHVVNLVESKRANLVVIADDVDPIGLVIYLPALCRKMGVPYVIVKSKSRLGTVVHKKTAAVLTVQDVRSEDQKELSTIISAAKANLFVSFFCIEPVIYIDCFLALTSTRSSAVTGVVVSVVTSLPR